MQNDPLRLKTSVTYQIEDAATSKSSAENAPFSGRALLGDVLPVSLLLNVYQYLDVRDWARGERV
jgi:hypothetical protein